mmetsp:Transcript_5904/g.11956  ORF Transcript_5904/g.11956 Transcript_5904/m.11956 type:complete len:215 (+) Transcript_5904:49-693(+)
MRQSPAASGPTGGNSGGETDADSEGSVSLVLRVDSGLAGPAEVAALAVGGVEPPAPHRPRHSVQVHLHAGIGLGGREAHFLEGVRPHALEHRLRHIRLHHPGLHRVALHARELLGEQRGVRADDNLGEAVGVLVLHPVPKPLRLEQTHVLRLHHELAQLVQVLASRIQELCLPLLAQLGPEKHPGDGGDVDHPPIIGHEWQESIGDQHRPNPIH